MSQIILATHNEGKVAEFQARLTPLNFELLPQSQFGIDEVPETGLTFVENALIKARHASAQTGLPAIADDSGIVVPVLNGEPGLYSARYAGEPGNPKANYEKLLENMKDFSVDQRQAKVCCTIVYLLHPNDPNPIIAQGVFDAVIAETPQGEGGFGYDPILWCPESQCTLAQLTREEKNKISHRGRALDVFLEICSSQALTEPL